MTYEYSIRKKAQKFIQKQDRIQQKRLLTAIYALPQGDVKKLVGEEYYRLRVGDFRVIFDMNEVKSEIILIDVIKVGNRGEIYNSN